MGEALRRCRKRLKLVHLSDTNQQVYRHDPVGAGDVPFAQVPPVLKEIGYKRLPMLEIIAPDAEKDILASADALAGMGYATRLKWKGGRGASVLMPEARHVQPRPARVASI